MRKDKGQQNRRTLADILRQLLDNRVFLIALICACVFIMCLSLYSIVRSLQIMRQNAAAELLTAQPAAQSPDPYYVPTPEPTPFQPPEQVPPPTEEATPEPTPEPPWGWKESGGSRYYLLENGDPLTGLHMVDGRLRYFNLYGQAASALGIDVSYHNKAINWDAVRAQGIDFAIIRLGYRGWETGLLHDDICFLQNLRGAKAAGLRVGVYIYSTAVNAAEAQEEAAFVLARLKGFPLDLPVWFDTEQSGDYPYGRADRLHKVRRYEIVSAFRRAIADGGYRVGVYSGQNYLKNHVAFHTLAEDPVWLASYTVWNKLPDFPYYYDMWQFTDGGSVAGIRGMVDMNVVYG